MARKKKKLKVDLDLPKDDKTLTYFYAICTVSILLGLMCMGFWFTNSNFFPGNDDAALPFFVSTYCQSTATDEFGNPNPQPFADARLGLEPSYRDNETCSLLKDSPSPAVWNLEEPWDGMEGKAKTFQVPGLPNSQLAGANHPFQELEVECLAESRDYPSLEYTVSILDADEQLPGDSWRHIGNANEQDGDCKILIQHAEPGEYQIRLIPTWPEGVSSAPDFEFTFTVTAMVYDGVPNYMNNKSQWIGPELQLGGFDLHPTIYINFFGFGFFLMIYPASVYWDRVQKNINAREEKFPDFLRDLAEYWKGGLSMTVAVTSLAQSEYGALNEDVKKMANQISWGVAFGDVLDLFALRVNTPLVKRAISLISEANKAGGKISDILVTAASDSREIKFLEAERSRTISSYIAVIWVSYLVFMVVIVILSRVFIPAIAESNSSSGGDSSAQIGNMQIRAIDPLLFLVVFFYGVTVQALGNGAMAGLMANGRLSSGFKHAGMMLVLAIFSFTFVSFIPSLIGVPSSPGLNPSIGMLRI
ncbi:MAG: hypothetical protein CMB56_004605 [Methanobacteriota archaeon]|nr:MAG: hypothetical protein CMB56_004605 [Euryarchaeota archaeon]